jgi:LysM repeat protein
MLVRRQAAFAEELATVRQEIRNLQSSGEMYDQRLSDAVSSRMLEGATDEYDKKLQRIDKKVDELQTRLDSMEEIWDKKLKALLSVVQNENARLQTAITHMERTAAASGWEHTVAPGESLAKIAAEYGVSVSAIVEANDIDDPDRIRVGQKLFIPRANP